MSREGVQTAIQALHSEPLQKIVEFFDNEAKNLNLASTDFKTKPPSELNERIIGYSSKYIEDTCATIAESILVAGRNVSALLAAQAAELDSVSRRIDAISMRVAAEETRVATRLHVGLTAARTVHPLAPMQKITQAAPKDMQSNVHYVQQRWAHRPIDLDALASAAGESGVPAHVLANAEANAAYYQLGANAASAAGPPPAMPRLPTSPMSGTGGPGGSFGSPSGLRPGPLYPSSPGATLASPLSPSGAFSKPLRRPQRAPDAVLRHRHRRARPRRFGFRRLGCVIPRRP